MNFIYDQKFKLIYAMFENRALVFQTFNYLSDW